MPNDHKLTPPFQIAHLSGGSKIIFGSNKKAILGPARNSKQTVLFDYAAPSHTHKIAAEMGLKMLAVDYGDIATEVDSPRSIHFSVYPFGAPEDSTIGHAVPYWSAVANAQADQNRAAQAARIGHQVSVLNVRLANTIRAYHQCATAFASGDDEFGLITGSGFTVQIATEIQGLLNDLYSLRDFILALYATLRFSEPPSLRKLRETLQADPQITELDSFILAELSEGGTVSALSRYRALVAHELPLLSMKSSFHTIRKVEFRERGVPRVIFPIFEELLATKARGKKQLSDRKIDVEYLRSLRDNPSPMDALDFCHAAFVMLLSIGAKMASHFKLRYEIITLSDKEIRSFSTK